MQAVQRGDLAKLGQTSTAFTHTGKSGLERYYEEALRGKAERIYFRNGSFTWTEL